MRKREQDIPTFNAKFKCKQLFNKYTKQKEKGIQLGQKWWEYKNLYLKQNPYCEECGVIAEQVHHIQPRSTHPELMYDWNNLQSLCKQCHYNKHKDKREDV